MSKDFDNPRPVADLINQPPHYRAGGLETIDVIEAFGLGFRLGNVIKYVLRHRHKGAALADLKKARWYLQREIAAQEPDGVADARVRAAELELAARAGGRAERSGDDLARLAERIGNELRERHCTNGTYVNGTYVSAPLDAVIRAVMAAVGGSSCAA